MLNDLSLLSLAEDVWQARQRMEQFIDLLVYAGRLGVERLLRTEYTFNNIELAPGYPVARWQNDSEVDRERRLYLKRWATRAPYIHHEDQADVQEMYDCADFFYGEDRQVARGLGAAYLLDTLALSFSSEPLWNCSFVPLLFEHLYDDDLQCTSVAVRHASSKKHIVEHRAWIENYTRLDVHSGAELCLHRAACYPFLLFCNSALEQLEALARGERHVHQVKRYLDELNAHSEQWKSGPFSFAGGRGAISAESTATLEAYAQERTFLCPDGISRLFSLHCKMNLDQWRIYFFPLKPGVILIGYVGRHLRTVQFRG